ncbi:MAG TPA: pyridoxamine 5'-phosphate oxidase family protein [Micromonosporaceae bacterium]|nr:pyridoxamine 5'-phosphate oxidase family protein [Micromonosporaceae bacterium]
MSEPLASRPYMPGYGIEPPAGGHGLLSWSWARDRIAAAHDYWLATVWPDGRPHVMPVWGVWHQESIWFSCSRGSRKARNLGADPRCSITTDTPREPVVVEGAARLVTDPEALATFLDLENAKYSTAYGLDLVDPTINTTFRVRPERVFGIAEDRFTSSPTRWVFPSS